HDGVNGDDYYLHSIAADFAVTERINYVLQSDWGSVSNGNSGQWYGVNNYLFYTINKCWKAGTRFEWFRDDDGFRGLGPGEFYEITCGVNWKPTANLTFRPELRYDWANGGPAPFDGGTADDQFAGGFDLIVTF
ncbi:MAG: outer membrane beta-barrel protein, partial [Thermoguttaceae bacterium]